MRFKKKRGDKNEVTSGGIYGPFVAGTAEIQHVSSEPTLFLLWEAQLLARQPPRRAELCLRRVFGGVKF